MPSAPPWQHPARDHRTVAAVAALHSNPARGFRAASQGSEASPTVIDITSAVADIAISRPKCRVRFSHQFARTFGEWTGSAISRMNGEVRTIFLFRILVTLCLVVGTAPTRAAETLRIGLQTTGTFAWQLDVIRRHGLAESAGLDLKISRIRFAGCGQARPQQRLGRSRRRRLALGRAGARARRQIAVLSLFQRRRRHHGEGRFAVARDRRPQGPRSRRCGRPARQELADRAGGRDPPGHRSQARCDACIRRAATDFPKAAAGRGGSEPQFLEFLRQPGDAGLPPYLRRARCRSRTRAEANRSH